MTRSLHAWPCGALRWIPARVRRGLCATAGQASVELVALLPLALIIGLAAFHVLAAGRAAEAAGVAAGAGAMAILQERDPQAAVRGALGGWPREAYRLQLAGRRVSVTVRPRGVRAVADHLVARATAYAGAPAPTRIPLGAAAVRGGDGALGVPR